MNLLQLYKLAAPGSVHENLNMSSVRVQYDGYEQQFKKQNQQMTRQSHLRL